MIDSIKQFSGLVGLKSWGVQRGHGSFLTLNFGDKSSRSSEYGMYHLWLYGAKWAIAEKELILCEDASDQSLIDKVAMSLNDKIITFVSVYPKRGVIEFDSMYKLMFKYGMDMDQWIFYTDDETIVCDSKLKIMHKCY